MLSRVPAPGARRRGLSCPRWAVGRIPAPASALRRVPWPRSTGRRGRGGGGVAPAAGGRGCSSAGFLALGVCRGCSVACFWFCSGRFGGVALCPLSGCALGRFRLGLFVPPFPSVAVGVCGGCSFLVAGCCVAFCSFMGPALAGAPRLLCCPSSGGRLCGVAAGLPVPAAVPLWLAALVGGSGGLGVPASLALFPSAAVAVVGFSGSRRLPPPFAPVVSGVVASVLAGGRSIAVGCAAGADAVVRSAAPSAVVFSASAFGAGRAAFARRSVALVRAVSAGGPGSGLVVFPAAPCPPGLVASARSSACFCGLGSGSWASAAFAAGLGLPVVVFPCGFSALPPWGVWVPAASAGVWAGGWRLVR